MSKKTITFRLDPELAALLDVRSNEWGVDKTSIVTSALEDHLNSLKARSDAEKRRKKRMEKAALVLRDLQNKNKPDPSLSPAQRALRRASKVKAATEK